MKNIFTRKKMFVVSLMVVMTILLSATLSFAQSAKSVTITGKVVDESGQSIVGATVMVEKTSLITTTNEDGSYALACTVGSKVVVTYLGYVDYAFDVNTQAVVYDVVLKEDALLLEDLVVVGYGTQKKVNLTGAVSTINFEEQVQSRPITNVSSSLAGLSPGISVRQTSGNPGSDGATIRIRGLGTLNNSEPLVLIDGMEAPIDAINPQDVATISILKDAASSAIYGSRAANGVILITTKTGRSDKFNVSYSGHVSFARPVGLYDIVSNYGDYMEYMNEGFEQLNQAPNFGQEIIDKWRAAEANPNAIDPASGLPNYVAYPNTDWHEEFFGQTKPIQEHNVSFSGGTERIRFMSSIGYLDNPGLVMKTGSKKFSARTNLEADITKWLTVGTRFWANEQRKEIGDFSTALGYVGQSAPGVYPCWEGKYSGAPISEERAGNPYRHLLTYDGDNVDNRINNTFYAKVKFFEGFSYELNFNYEKRMNEQSSWNSNIALWNLNNNTIHTAEVADASKQITEYRYSNHKYTLENLLRFNRSFGEHTIGALAGYQEYYYYEESLSTTKKGLLDVNVHTLSAAEEMVSTSGSASDLATRSFFGRINYDYKDRYLFEANLRYDATSKLKKDYRWGAFPSFSAGWRVSEENFMNNVKDVINNLKIRASWGMLGNTNGIGNYAYQSTYSIVNYSLGGSQAQGLAATSLANQMIRWEATTVANVGVDLSMLKSRLNATVEVYDKYTDGILYTPTIPITTGSKTAPVQNIAQVSNKGIEVSLGWQDQKDGFQYAITGNFSYNKNRVEKYRGEYKAGWEVDESGNRVWVTNLGDVSTGGTSRVLEGKMINEYYMRSVYKGNGKAFNGDGTVNVNGGPTDGMIRTEQDMEWLNAMRAAGYTFYPRMTGSNSKTGKTTVWYGDYIYADQNGDGIYGNSYDSYFRNISSTPKINFGLQLSMAYKGFDFSALLAGAAGFMLYWGPSTGYNAPQVRLGVSIPQHVVDDHYFYDPSNPSDPRTNTTAKYGRLINAETGYQNNFESDLYLFKGDYVKLKNLTIGYTLPTNISRKIYMQGVRFYVSGENLFTLTKYPGVDPEMGAGVGYVTLRQIALGLNITF